MEAVLPIEIEIPSHLISLERQLPEEERHRERLAQLEWLDEKRLRAAHHAQIYQRRIYQKKVLERRFEVGDLVLKKIFPSVAPGKFGPNWEGPYVVTTVHPWNAYRIANSEGEE